MKFINIYFKSKHKIIWFMIIAFGLFNYLSIVKFETISLDVAATNQIIESMPKLIQVIFGFNNLAITNATNYFAILALYYGLILSIFASYQTAHLINKEHNEQIGDFIYTLPIKISKILKQKLISLYSLMAIVNSGCYLILRLTNNFATSYDLNYQVYNQIWIGIILIELFFISSALIITLLSKAKSAKFAILSVIIFYLIHVINASTNEQLFLLNPFSIYAPNNIINYGINNYFAMIVIIFNICSIAVFFKKFKI